MTLAGLGSNRRRVRIPVLGLLSGGLLLASVILLAIELVRFAQSRSFIQTDITVAGIPVTGLQLSQAVTMWESYYQQPVELEYQGHPILLNPADIGFRVNNDLMLQAVRAKIEGTNNYWQDFWNYLWWRPTSPIVVDLMADYSEAKLRGYLEDIAGRYDRGASTASFDMNTLTFGSGSAGLRLDLKKALEEVQKALMRPLDRKVKLPMQSEGARSADMDTLRQAIQDYLNVRNFTPNGPQTVASVIVIDLQTGQEMQINADVAYSAVSSIKIPIMINTFSRLAFAPEVEIKWLMGASILCSSNDSSNLLMQTTGVGDGARARLADGLRQVTETAQALGARNTFISAPLDIGVKEAQFSIQSPATTPNPRFNTKPDPWNQTTAEDMAGLLQQIYDCAEYGSGLMAAFPDKFTQAECKQMIELLSGNIIGRLIELGVPPGTRVAHKNGWGGAKGGASGAPVNDAAIVFTPGGNYILSVYMWEAKANADGLGSLLPWQATEGISQVVYNFFNPDKPLLVSRVPENPLGAVDCVMPNAHQPEKLDLNNIRNGRFDAEGHIEPDACYAFPACKSIPGGSK